MSDSNDRTQFMTIALPPHDMLAAMGAVVARQAHLDYMLRMTVKTIRNRDVLISEALGETKGDWSGDLRKRVEDLAKERLGDGDALGQLAKLLKRCREATEKRHKFAHPMFASKVDRGEHFMLSDDDKWEPLPAVSEVNALANELFLLAGEVNEARFDGGFLFEALKRAPTQDA